MPLICRPPNDMPGFTPQEIDHTIEFCMSWVNSLIKRLYLPMSVAGLGSLSTGNVVRGSTLVGMVVTRE
jgi:hypothetical protein